jgi:hypothetical protein
MRLVWLTLALALAVIIPFIIWGGRFEQWLTLDGTVAMIRGWGAWGWLGVIALLIGDLFLPGPGDARHVGGLVMCMGGLPAD